MPWWGWLIIGGCIGYASALFQIGRGLGGLRAGLDRGRGVVSVDRGAGGSARSWRVDRWAEMVTLRHAREAPGLTTRPHATPAGRGGSHSEWAHQWLA